MCRRTGYTDHKDIKMEEIPVCLEIEWDNSRISMKYFLNRKGLNFSMINVLNDKFDHRILFKFLRDINLFKI